MANENVKIVIQEINETLPKGAGTSSDVAYIPGLAVTTPINAAGDKYALKNTPQLCNTVAEFESYFGTEPYRMNAEDISILSTHYPHLTTMYGDGAKVNNVDLSYVYAKELLNAGMSVIYENICPEHTADSLMKVSVPEAIDLADDSLLVAMGDGQFTFKGIRTVEGNDNTEEYTLKLRLPAYKDNDNGKVTGENDAKEGAVTINFNVKSTLSADFALSLIPVIECSEGWGSSPSDTNGRFILDASDAYNQVITWTNIPEEVFEYAYFTIKLTIKHSNLTDADIDVPFSVVAVKGKPTAAATENANIEITSRIEYLYTQLADRFKVMEDKNEYSIKYLTSGGYPTFFTDGDESECGVAVTMTSVCANRGDAVALIDHQDDPSLPLYGEGSVFSALQKSALASDPNATFGSMFSPYAYYTLPATSITVGNKKENFSGYMSASFAYLMCMAVAIKTSPNWLAMAGVTRGAVPYIQKLNTNTILSNVIAENYQPKFGSDSAKISMNAITNIKPYGLCIWGNRTLEPVDPKGTTALNFINTRNMISDIKKLAYSTAKSLMFEQDSDTLWLRFKSGVAPLLNQLKSGFGISNFKLIRGTTKYNGDPLTRGEMAAVIKIYPLYAIEYFEITVVISDEEVSVQ